MKGKGMNMKDIVVLPYTLKLIFLSLRSDIIEI